MLTSSAILEIVSAIVSLAGSFRADGDSKRSSIDVSLFFLISNKTILSLVYNSTSCSETNRMKWTDFRRMRSVGKWTATSLTKST